MLLIETICKCGSEWADGRADSEILAKSFSEQDTATVIFECLECAHKIPVCVTRNTDGTDYVAIPPSGYGDVMLSKNPDDDQFEIDLDSYLDNVVSDDPNGVFVFALEDVDWVLDNAPTSTRDSQTFIRMVFTQLFAIYETYLADRLIRLVKEDDMALKALVASHSSWQDERLTFKDAFNAVEVVRERVLQTLAKILYHDLSKVDPIYRAVFGCSIFANAEDRKLLFQSVQIRHDCVHRNGKTINGVLHQLARSQLYALADTMGRSRQRVEDAYERKYSGHCTANR